MEYEGRVPIIMVQGFKAQVWERRGSMRSQWWRDIKSSELEYNE